MEIPPSQSRRYITLLHKVHGKTLVSGNVRFSAKSKRSELRRTGAFNDGVDAPPTASMRQSGGVKHHLREASVSEVSIISLDIAKNGAAPSMRFVAVKSEQQQAAGLVFRTRDLLVRQRTQLINAIRGHLAEYGWIAPKGPSHVAMLADLLEEEEMASSLPEAARAMFRLMLDLLAGSTASRRAT